jgi:hypothetical protein
MSRFQAGDRVVHLAKILGSGTLVGRVSGFDTGWLVDTDSGKRQHWTEINMSMEVSIEALAKTFEAVPVVTTGRIRE